METLNHNFKHFIHISHTYTKEMSAKEFLEFASTKRHLIRKSTFVPARFRSGRKAKFIVEINDGNFHIIKPRRRE